MRIIRPPSLLPCLSFLIVEADTCGTVTSVSVREIKASGAPLGSDAEEAGRGFSPRSGTTTSLDRLRTIIYRGHPPPIRSRHLPAIPNPDNAPPFPQPHFIETPRKSRAVRVPFPYFSEGKQHPLILSTSESAILTICNLMIIYRG